MSFRALEKSGLPALLGLDLAEAEGDAAEIRIRTRYRVRRAKDRTSFESLDGCLDPMTWVLSRKQRVPEPVR